MKLLVTVLGNRDLSLVGAGWSAASLGNWAFSILLAIYAYRAGGPDAVALALVVRMLPSAVAAPYAAMLSDRYSRRAILLWSAIVRAAILAAAGAAAGAGAPLGVVLAFAALHAIANTAQRPAQAALLPRLARTPSELAAANVGWSAIDYAGFLLGGALAGVLPALVGLGTAFAVCAGWFVLAAGAVSLLPRDPRQTSLEGGRRSLTELLAGARVVATDREIRVLVGLYSVNVLAQGVIDVLLVVTAIELLDLGEGGVGWLNAAWGVGGLAGGVVALALLARGRLASGLVFGLALAGSALAATGAVAQVAPAFALLATMGVGFALVESASLTLTQRVAADDVLARVFGVEEAIHALALGLGSVLAAALVSALDVRAAMGIAGGMLLLAALAAAARLPASEAAVEVPEASFRLIRDVPLFSMLPVATIENLAVRARAGRYSPGEAIIRQGDRGDDFHVISGGEVEIVVDGVPIRRRETGDFFGEIALLRDAPRMATVVATDGAETLAIGRAQFLGAIGGHSLSSGAAEAVVGDRLAEGRRRPDAK